jgi:hypothetical protein
MNMSRRDVAGAIAATVAAGFVLRSTDAEAGCPNIANAVGPLQAAQRDLADAKHDYGGHRADALAAVNEALRQLGLCLTYTGCK